MMLHEGLTIFDFTYVLLLAVVCFVAAIAWREGYLNGYEDGRKRWPPRVRAMSLKNRIKIIKMRIRRYR